ncbi:hypothetical protein F0562_033984 [Nyssa sinensis]|uniref:Peptidase A1 domain-containing protein n=1 Tax=Nyssa sinensis TaxID=561372 RepID=A0A5J5AIF4_9ASTE|nr:hypothetical protein F0562_033984 [Nyssa sinensis]
MVVLSPLLSLSLLFSLSLLLTFTDLCNSTQPITQNITTEYLKLRLLHRKPFSTPSEALSSDSHRLAVLFSALHRRKTPKLPITSGASTGSGQYFIDLRLGTPPQSLLLVADTGSDLVWVTCSACHNCSNHLSSSAFLARHSATFSPHHCFDSACQLIPHPKHTPCNHTRLHSPCSYEYSYADGSKTNGFFSTETTLLNTSSGGLLKHENLAFGCGFRISGPGVTGPSFNGAQGVMGLGRGPISFTSQLGSRFDHKFSYLSQGLHSLSASDKLSHDWGRHPKCVSVNGVKLPINPSVWAVDKSGNGGTIVDSGTTLTFLAEPAYRQILTAFKRRIKLPSPAELTLGFDLCVNVSNVSKLSLPRLSFKLMGDSVFAPPPSNYFLDTAAGVKCLALQPVSSPAGFSGHWQPDATRVLVRVR